MKKDNSTKASNECCKSSNGNSKKRYSTKFEAMEVKEIRELESPSIMLEVYKCKSGKGYHLTKSDQLTRTERELNFYFSN